MPVALKELLLDLATNNETSFFRDQKIFKAIGKVVLNAVSGNALNTRRLDIWSAASSTGQEAISLSILINEYNLSAKDKVDYSILATDISERVLSRAKDATYTQLEVQRGLSEALLAKYFQRIEDRFQAKSEIRRHIEFKKLNLKEAFPFSQKFHLVLCRNVLIYQNVERKKDILNRIAATLVPRGFLVLGSGESLLGVSSDFESENVDGAIIYRKKT